MAVLANCWLIIEFYLIPDGFMKWFFLSFYINPCFLFFCQIYLWIKTLQRWILLVIFLLDQYIFSPVLTFLRRFLIITHSSSGVSNDNNEAEDEDVWYEETDSYSPSDGILFLRYDESYKYPNIAFTDFVESVDQETIYVHSSSDVDDEITTSSGCSSPASSYSFSSRRDDMEVTSTSPSSSYTLPDYPEAANVDGAKKGLTDFVTPLLVIKPDEDEEEKDSFYKLYTERMSWFDLLSEERSSGLNALLTKKEHSGGEKRIIKSLESDIEMVYVAQSCLSWEALHDQYRKLQGIIASSCNDDGTNCASPYGALCSGALVNKFQRFHILLERFMEDERSEKGKRYWNFVTKRASQKSLLQVPDVSENESNDTKGRIGGMMIRATDVLITIEKCIKTFKSFIEIGEKKPWWRTHKRLSRSRSPLEDPQDYSLLHNLTHTLRQKELWMKDLKGKGRCWLKRSMKVMEEDVHEKEMMFVIIELKLVTRLLMMPVISTSQLQWCKQKLDNIKISHGRISRTCTRSLLFPPS